MSWLYAVFREEENGKQLALPSCRSALQRRLFNTKDQRSALQSRAETGNGCKRKEISRALWDTPQGARAKKVKRECSVAGSNRRHWTKH